MAGWRRRAGRRALAFEPPLLTAALAPSLPPPSFHPPAPQAVGVSAAYSCWGVNASTRRMAGLLLRPWVLSLAAPLATVMACVCAFACAVPRMASKGAALALQVACVVAYGGCAALAIACLLEPVRVDPKVRALGAATAAPLRPACCPPARSARAMPPAATPRRAARTPPLLVARRGRCTPPGAAAGPSLALSPARRP